MEYALFMTLGLIHMAGLISPGPDFALVLKNSTDMSRKLALISATGIALGVATHATLSVTGVSLLIQQSETLYAIIQWGGIGYLAWLGGTTLKSVFSQAWAPTSQAPAVKKGRWQALSLGYLTNLLNPKALMYFIGMVAAIVPAQLSMQNRIWLIVELFLLTLLWFGGLAYALSSPSVQTYIRKVEKGLNLITGVLFVLLAFALAINTMR